MNLAAIKSLIMAGVEWELITETVKTSQLRLEANTSQSAKNASVITHTPMSYQKILAEGTRLAAQDDINNAICQFHAHPLYNSAKNTVLPWRAGKRLCVVTDMPSLSDDATGEILSGVDGKLFDKMMTAIGIARSEVTIIPLVFWRSAGGRSPTDEELAATRPIVDRLIGECGAPKILTLGKLAAEQIAGAKLPGDHGKVFGNVIVTYKPDFIAQNPGIKAAVFEALKKVTNF